MRLKDLVGTVRLNPDGTDNPAFASQNLIARAIPQALYLGVCASGLGMTLEDWHRAVHVENFAKGKFELQQAVEACSDVRVQSLIKEFRDSMLVRYEGGTPEPRRFPQIGSCWFFAKGTCRAGAKCPFRHDGGTAGQPLQVMEKGRGKSKGIAGGNTAWSEPNSEVPWSSAASGGWEEAMSDHSDPRDVRAYVGRRSREWRGDQWQQPAGWQDRARRDWFERGNMGSGDGTSQPSQPSSGWQDDVSSQGWAAPGAWRVRSQL